VFCDYKRENIKRNAKNNLFSYWRKQEIKWKEEKVFSILFMHILWKKWLILKFLEIETEEIFSFFGLIFHEIILNEMLVMNEMQQN
jgi:hypothetical protein